jgi:hypothetical protein
LQPPYFSKKSSHSGIEVISHPLVFEYPGVLEWRCKEPALDFFLIGSAVKPPCDPITEDAVQVLHTSRSGFFKISVLDVFLGAGMAKTTPEEFFESKTPAYARESCVTPPDCSPRYPQK